MRKRGKEKEKQCVIDGTAMRGREERMCVGESDMRGRREERSAWKGNVRRVYFVEGGSKRVGKEKG